MFSWGSTSTTRRVTLSKDSGVLSLPGRALMGLAIGTVAFLGASFTLPAAAGVITFDDFSASKPNVMIRANPIDVGSAANTSGSAADYWSSRSFRIVTTTGGVNRTLGFIENGRLEVANSDGISSRVGLSWTSQNIPAGITGWTLTAELLTLDTGTVSTLLSSVPMPVGAVFSPTLVTLGTGSALAAINNEFYIDSGPSSDFTLDNVKLSFTCRAITDTTPSGITSAIASASGPAGDGCQASSVPLPSSLLLLGLSGLMLLGVPKRRASGSR